MNLSMELLGNALWPLLPRYPFPTPRRAFAVFLLSLLLQASSVTPTSSYTQLQL